MRSTQKEARVKFLHRPLSLTNIALSTPALRPVWLTSLGALFFHTPSDVCCSGLGAGVYKPSEHGGASLTLLANSHCWTCPPGTYRLHFEPCSSFGPHNIPWQ